MNESLNEFLATLDPTRPALHHEGATLHVGELVERSARVASALRSLGIGTGERVGLWLPNAPEWLILFFACARVGAIAVSINTRFRAHEVGDIVARAGCRMLALAPAFKAIDFGGILADVEPAALAGVTHTIVVGPGTASRPLPGTTVPFAALLAAAPDDATPAGADSRCVLFTTSGTTSAPKFVCHVQRAVTRHARDAARGFGLDAPGTQVLQALPLCGVFGFTQALAALAAGAPMHLQSVFDPAASVALFDTCGITHLCGSDDMMARLLAATPAARPFPTLRFFGYASFNPALEDIAEQAAARGVVMCGLYGMSECHALYAVQAPDAPLAVRRHGGGIPVSPHARVRVVDPETGRELAVGEAGELQITGPSLFTEYFGNPTATAQAFTRDGYFRTGDLACRQDDGGFRYLTRMGDVLRLAGFLTSPLEIEAVLDAHPAVAASQVVGVTWQQRPIAVGFVVSRTAGSGDEATLRDWCATRLAGYKVPQRIFAVMAFPTTPSANGTKIQRARLREMALERLAEEADRAG